MAIVPPSGLLMAVPMSFCRWGQTALQGLRDAGAVRKGQGIHRMRCRD
jgi:hypothetical protein